MSKDWWSVNSGNETKDADQVDQVKLAPLLAGQRVLGVIRSYNNASGFGFIVCRETQELMGQDCFIQRAEADPIGASVGATVSFTVELNKDGKPRAKNVKLEARGVDAKVAEVTQQEEKVAEFMEQMADKVFKKHYFGWIKSFNPGSSFGFIHCDETFAIFGRDVFLHTNNKAHFDVNSEIAFKLKVDPDKGTPQAIELKMYAAAPDEQGADIGSSGIGMIGMLGMMSMMGMDTDMLATMFGVNVTAPEPAPKGRGRGGPIGGGTTDLAMNASGMSNFEWQQRVNLDEELKEAKESRMDKLLDLVEAKHRFVGIIRCWNRARGFGFIGCDEAQAATGSDVFLHNEQRMDFDVGDVISFSMQIRNGSSRAIDLRKASGPNDKGGNSPAKEGPSKNERIRRELADMCSAKDGMDYGIRAGDKSGKSRSRSARRNHFGSKKKSW